MKLRPILENLKKSLSLICRIARPTYETRPSPQPPSCPPTEHSTFSEQGVLSKTTSASSTLSTTRSEAATASPSLLLCRFTRNRDRWVSAEEISRETLDGAR